MFYDYLDTGLIGTLTLIGDEQGLVHLDFEKEKYPLAIQPGWSLRPSVFNAAKAQLQDYFNGTLRQFDLPLAPRGTAFQHRVWQALR